MTFWKKRGTPYYQQYYREPTGGAEYGGAGVTSRGFRADVRSVEAKTERDGVEMDISAKVVIGLAIIGTLGLGTYAYAIRKK